MNRKTLIVVAVSCLMLAVGVTLLASLKPSVETIKRRIESTLPAGGKILQPVTFEPKLDKIEFRVQHQDYGQRPIEFRVSRFKLIEDTTYISAYLTVESYNPSETDQEFHKPLACYQFDQQGRMKLKEIDASEKHLSRIKIHPREGEWIERLASQLAESVRKAY